MDVTLIVVIVGVLGLALTLWNGANWYLFQSGYRYNSEFLGKRYECSLKFVNAEHNNLCFVGGDGAALYLLAHPNGKGWWWRYGVVGYKKNLQIPWSDVECRPKTVLFKECMWFEIPARKIYFYIPREIGDKLLIDAGRKIGTAQVGLSENSEATAAHTFQS